MSRVRTDGHDREESGAATVVVLATVCVAVSLIGTALAAVRIGLDAVHAADAADSAAIAGAAAVAGLTVGPPCSVAARVAAANGVDLDRCEVDTARVTVRVRVVSAGIPLVARARAGPDERSVGVRRTARGSGRSGVYGVPVGPPPPDTTGPLERHGRATTACTIDQGVTCQARRSS
jgi:secretion/DNA translocation related TadE-like protein